MYFYEFPSGKCSPDLFCAAIRAGAPACLSRLRGCLYSPPASSSFKKETFSAVITFIPDTLECRFLLRRPILLSAGVPVKSPRSPHLPQSTEHPVRHLPGGEADTVEPMRIDFLSPPSQPEGRNGALTEDRHRGRHPLRVWPSPHSRTAVPKWHISAERLITLAIERPSKFHAIRAPKSLRQPVAHLLQLSR